MEGSAFLKQFHSTKNTKYPSFLNEMCGPLERINNLMLHPSWTLPLFPPKMRTVSWCSWLGLIWHIQLNSSSNRSLPPESAQHCSNGQGNSEKSKTGSPHDTSVCLRDHPSGPSATPLSGSIRQGGGWADEIPQIRPFVWAQRGLRGAMRELY